MTTTTTSVNVNNNYKKQKQKKKNKARKPQPKPQRVAPVLAHIDDGQFGDLQLNQSQFRTDRVWVAMKDLNVKMDGKQVWLRSRVHTVRGKGKVCFYLLRHGFCKVQAVLLTGESMPREMVRYASKIPPESIVDLFATVKAVTAAGKEIKTATGALQNLELVVHRLYAISVVTADRLPFEMCDASRPESEYKNNDDNENNNQNFVHVGQNIRLDNRWIDLRTTANHAIFRIQAGVARFFREFLTDQDFIEIHSPKLIGAASEGGADVFKLQYFGKDAFLAQSPQLYKQMALCSDFHRVFEIGPVFRAEDSNTHRHLCEFTGMDIEMEFYEHYHEVLDVIGRMFVYMFDHLQSLFAAELDAVREQYPFEDLLYPRDLLILTFKEAHDMLMEYEAQLRAEQREEEADALMMGKVKDFSTPGEKALGMLVRKKYKTDFFCVDKYPISARPFYTMVDPYNKSVSNSYDFFIRGEEIISGAQRIHDSKFLIERAEYHNIDIQTLEAYINSFQYGTCPHAGCGIGLERVLMLFLGLDNIRKASLFPRDPTRCQP